jgi:regulator of replication initiation timing
LDIESRTTEEWVEIHNASNSTIKSNEETILDLQSQLDNLKRKINEMSDENKQLSGKYERQRKRVQRARPSFDDGQSTEQEQDNIERQSLMKFLALVADHGGISCMTIFNNEWHSKHPQAARILWGYNNLTEAKLYVGPYFPGEVDTN